MKRAHYLQHVPFEGPGALQPWLVEQGWALTCTRAYLGEALPAHEGIDFVVALGGPMSVDEAPLFPWIDRERRFLAEAVERGMPTLGICLGAQLMASALGGRVRPAEQPEIGWLPVYGREPPAPVYRFPSECLAFHWHGETFELPEGAALLASSETCAHQAFQQGPYAIGIQFHLETTRATMEELIQHGEDELVDAPGIESAASMRRADEARFATLHRAMGDLLAYLLRDVR